ncbi:O-antigen/teichoic acid export membrane protein [Rhodoblastus acidophilus]|uniref:oligosaccharide flippase family protein n=1 Tax=Rhodoblastus acidophilus TaxID=1074 RepID=UPI0022240D2B|nr:oligosaccharide flippase family protein [Rhodoblastus acidophilus]MCW2316620.1 O-antigen/teichoic acid export membrane protein [Rhodoblastus acidophilus]
MRPRLLRSYAANLAAPLTLILVVAITVPLYVRQIGLERYGVIALVTMLASYSGVFDLGLGRSVIHALSQAGEARERRAEILWTACALNAALGCLGGALVFLAARYALPRWGGLPPEIVAEAWAVPACAGALVATTLAGGVATGALESREKFGVVNLIQLAGGVLAQIGALAIAHFVDCTLSALMIFIVAAQVVTAATMAVQALKREQLGRPRFPKPEVARALLSYGGWIAATNLMAPLLEAADQVCVAAWLGAGRLPFYSVPLTIVLRLQLVASALSRALFPRFASLSGEDARAVALRSLDAARFLYPALFGAAAIAADFVLSVWIGRDFAEAGAAPLRILAIGAAFNALAFTPFSILQATGRPALVAQAHFLEIPPYLLVLAAAVNGWGVAGAACAWSLRVAIDYVVLLHFSGLIRAGGWASVLTPALLMALGVGLAALAPTGAAALLWSAGFALACLALGAALATDLRAASRLAQQGAARIGLARGKASS